MYINLLFITLLIVFALDTTDFYETISSAITKALTHGKLSQPRYIKPFSCSLCMTFWTGLFYIIFFGSFSVGAVAYVGLLSFLTPVFADLLHLIKDTLTRIIDDIRNYFNINA